jgi:hypothetical protein
VRVVVKSKIKYVRNFLSLSRMRYGIFGALNIKMKLLKRVVYKGNPNNNVKARQDKK